MSGWEVKEVGLVVGDDEEEECRIGVGGVVVSGSDGCVVEVR